MAFSSLTKLYNQPHNLIPEYFHCSKTETPNPSQLKLTPPPLGLQQPLICLLSMELSALDISYEK